MQTIKQKLISIICVISLLAGCNDHQSAEKLTDEDTAVFVSSSVNGAVANNVTEWLAVKEKEYGDSGVLVELSATVTDASIAPTIVWQQVSGPTATILNSTQLNASVVLPFVTKPTELIFSVTATGNGQALTATQTITTLPLVARVLVVNPVLSVTDTAVSVTLLAPVAADTLFNVSIVGGSAEEGVDFAELPDTIAVEAPTQLSIPITLLANNRTQDVYSKIALQAPNVDVITITVIAPAETAIGTQPPSNSSQIISESSSSLAATSQSSEGELSASSVLPISSANSVVSSSSVDLPAPVSSASNSSVIGRFDTREAYRQVAQYVYKSWDNIEVTPSQILSAIKLDQLDSLPASENTSYEYDELGRLWRSVSVDPYSQTVDVASYSDSVDYLLESSTETFLDLETSEEIVSIISLDHSGNSVVWQVFNESTGYVTDEGVAYLGENGFIEYADVAYSLVNGDVGEDTFVGKQVFDWQGELLAERYLQDESGAVDFRVTFNYEQNVLRNMEWVFRELTESTSKSSVQVTYYKRGNKVYQLGHEFDTASGGHIASGVNVYEYGVCHKSEWLKKTFDWDEPNHRSCVDDAVISIAEPLSATDAVISSESASSASSVAAIITPSSVSSSSSILSSPSSEAVSSAASSSAEPLADAYRTREAYRVVEEIWIPSEVGITLDDILLAIEFGRLDVLNAKYTDTYEYDELGRLKLFGFTSGNQIYEESYSYSDVEDYLIESSTDTNKVDDIGEESLSLTEFFYSDSKIQSETVNQETGLITSVERSYFDERGLIDYSEFFWDGGDFSGLAEGDVIHDSSDYYDWSNGVLKGWYRSDANGDIYERYSYFYQDGFLKSADYLLDEMTPSVERYFYYEFSGKIYFIGRDSNLDRHDSFIVRTYEAGLCHRSEWIKLAKGWDMPNYLSCLDSEVISIAEPITALSLPFEMTASEVGATDSRYVPRVAARKISDVQFDGNDVFTDENESDYDAIKRFLTEGNVASTLVTFAGKSNFDEYGRLITDEWLGGLGYTNRYGDGLLFKFRLFSGQYDDAEIWKINEGTTKYYYYEYALDDQLDSDVNEPLIEGLKLRSSYANTNYWAEDVLWGVKTLGVNENGVEQNFLEYRRNAVGAIEYEIEYDSDLMAGPTLQYYYNEDFSLDYAERTSSLDGEFLSRSSRAYSLATGALTGYESESVNAEVPSNDVARDAIYYISSGDILIRAMKSSWSSNELNELNEYAFKEWSYLILDFYEEKLCDSSVWYNQFDLYPECIEMTAWEAAENIGVVTAMPEFLEVESGAGVYAVGFSETATEQ